VVHLGDFERIFSSVFTPFLAFLRPPWSPVEWTFRRFGPIVIGLARPLFRPLLVPLLDRVFGRLEIRLCFLPYKNCLDVCLTIRHKSSHPLRVRSVARSIKPVKLDFSGPGLSFSGAVLPCSVAASCLSSCCPCLLVQGSRSPLFLQFLRVST
jgi:hypothetical protein